MVRINFRPEPIELGKADEVHITHSQSTPGKFHVTVLLAKPVVVKRFGADPVWVLCSCPGFMNHGKCFHRDNMIGQEDGEET